MRNVWDVQPPKRKWNAADYAIARWVTSLPSRGAITNGVAVLVVFNPKMPSRSYIVKEQLA